MRVRATRPLMHAWFSHAQAIFCLRQSALYAALFGGLSFGATYVAIRVAEQLRVEFPRHFLRRGRVGLPMGLGLLSACVGGKQGIAYAIDELELQAACRSTSKPTHEQQCHDSSVQRSGHGGGCK